MKNKTIMLTVYLRLEGPLGRECNTLLVKAGRIANDPAKGAELFLTHINLGDGVIDESMEFDAGRIQPVSLAQACSWYARCEQLIESSDGSAAILCEMAADALQALDEKHRGGPRVPVLSGTPLLTTTLYLN